MERWKKGLLVGLFSSMLLEQQVVEAAVGLSRPGESAATAVLDRQLSEQQPSTTDNAHNTEEVSLQATEAERELLAQISRERIKRFARFIPKFDAAEEAPAANRRVLAETDVHEHDHIQQAEREKQAAEEARKREAERRQIASRGEQTGFLQVQRRTVTQNAGSNASPTLNKQAGVTATQGSQAATVAAKYVGVPYVYGGTTPSGFDCSGFIQYVMQEVGIEVPRTTYQQINAGSQVSRAALQPGDLVFFSGGGSPTSHAGIYLGNGKFIHADGTDGVTVDDLDSGYWAGVYQAGVRVR